MFDQSTGERVEPKPFREWLDEQRRGATHFELSEMLCEVVTAVAETGKKGSVTLKINVAPSGDGMVVVTDEVNAKTPEPDRSASLYFYDDYGRLSREDPRQQKLDLRGIRDARDAKENKNAK